jgi:uncharacterized protein (TIGR03435 family)
MATNWWKLVHPLLYAPGLFLFSCPHLSPQTEAGESRSRAATATPISEATKSPSFSVISVKLNRIAQDTHDTPTADGYSATGVTLKTLLAEAYGIREDSRIIGAPPWADTYRYDIQAKVDDSDVAVLQKLSVKQRYQMIRQILTERFNITVRREKRAKPIYSLVIIKKDRLPPLADVSSYPNGLVARNFDGKLTLVHVSMEGFTTLLSARLDRIVVDNTGLTGMRDFKLDWAPDHPGAADSASSLPSIFTAVQEQLGLKLVPTKAPVECLVIDHVEPPSEN